MFEIELFICIKMELELITYNGWCAIKPNQKLFISLSLSIAPAAEEEEEYEPPKPEMKEIKEEGAVYTKR